MIKKIFILSASFLTTVYCQCLDDKSDPTQIEFSSGKKNVSFSEYGSKREMKCEIQFIVPATKNQYLAINITTRIENLAKCVASYWEKGRKKWSVMSPCSIFDISSSDTCLKSSSQLNKSLQKQQMNIEAFSVKLTLEGTYDETKEEYRYPGCFMMQYEFLECMEASDNPTMSETTYQKNGALPTATKVVQTKPSSTTTHSTMFSSTKPINALTTLRTKPSSTTTHSTIFSSTTPINALTTLLRSSVTSEDITTFSTSSFHPKTPTDLNTTFAMRDSNATINTSNASVTAPILNDSKMYLIVPGTIIPVVLIILVATSTWFYKKGKQEKNETVKHDDEEIDLQSVPRAQSNTNGSFDSVESAHDLGKDKSKQKENTHVVISGTDQTNSSTDYSPKIVYSAVIRKPKPGFQVVTTRYTVAANNPDEHSSYGMVDNIIYEM